MADGLVPDVGIATPLTYWLQASVSGVVPWTLIVFVNDYTPDHTTVLANLTEATWEGYHSLSVTRSLWTTPTVSNDCAVSTWGTTFYTWPVLGPTIQTNYGWAMWEMGSNNLMWVQRFDDADINPVEIGGSFQLWPRVTLTNAPCPGDGGMSLGVKVRRTRKV